MSVSGVYAMVPRSEVPRGANICTSKFIYDVKSDEHRNLTRHKVRWVAKGFSQQYGKDYWETFSPVVRMSSVRALLSHAIQQDHDIKQCDLSTTFLESELPAGCNIFVAPPEGHAPPKGLYGLKQSSRLWYS